MSEPIRIPSDDAIERGLASRAPHRSDAALLDAVMTGVRATRQVPRRGALLRDPIGDRRRPIVLSAVAAVLIVAGMLVVSTGSFAPTMPTPPPPPPAATPPAAVVAPSSVPASTVPLASASPVTCATETTRVLTGDAMPPTDTQPGTIDAGVLTVGVYMTSLDGPYFGTQHDVWAITSGKARRIASIVGPDFNVAGLDDVSLDGRTALINIGETHVSTVGPECGDLHAVRTDGSGATRLTFKGPGTFARDGRLSPDGRYAAFVSYEMGAAAPTIGLVDLQGDPTEGAVLCDALVDDLHLAWSTTDDRLAAVCRGTLMVVPVGGSPARVVGAVDTYEIPTQRPTDDQAFVGVGWRDPNRILVVTATGGQRANGPLNLTTVTIDGGRQGTWSPVVASQPWLADGGPSSGIAVSPDGRAVALYGDPDKDGTQGDTLALYAMDATTGLAQPVAHWGAPDVAWSSDSRSILYGDTRNADYFVTVFDVARTSHTPHGSFPAGSDGAIWRAP